jgi:putative lysine transport system ATP-binding protein
MKLSCTTGPGTCRLRRCWSTGILFVFLLGPISQHAQTKRTPPRDLFHFPRLLLLKHASKELSRELKYQVIIPAGYDKDVRTRYSTLFLLHGLSGHSDNWAIKTMILAYAARQKFLIVMPEGSDGWYTDSMTVANDKYESYIVREMVPMIDSKFRTLADREHRFIAGLSMGGYGAIKFGLKYPEMFSLVGSFSGALDAPMRTEKSGNKWPSIPAVFGPEGSQARADNDIFTLIRDLPQDKVSTLPFIYFDCGTEDAFIRVNRDFATLLLEKKVAHEFRQLPGRHGWPYWDQQVQEFLRVANKRLGNTTSLQGKRKMDQVKSYE